RRPLDQPGVLNRDRRLVREDGHQPQVVTRVLVQANLDVDDDADQAGFEDDGDRQHRLVGFSGPRDVDAFWVPLGIAHQGALLGFGYPAGDALAHLDGEGLGGHAVVLDAPGVTEIHRSQRVAVVFQQVDTAMVVGKQGGARLPYGLANCRDTDHAGPSWPQLLHR